MGRIRSVAGAKSRKRITIHTSVTGFPPHPKPPSLVCTRTTQPKPPRPAPPPPSRVSYVDAAQLGDLRHVLVAPAGEVDDEVLPLLHGLGDLHGVVDGVGRLERGDDALEPARAREEGEGGDENGFGGARTYLQSMSKPSRACVSVTAPYLALPDALRKACSGPTPT